GVAMLALLMRVDGIAWFHQTFWARSAVKTISRHSYNIYLNHALFITLLANVYPGFDVSSKLGSHPIAAFCLSMGVVMAVSLGFSLVAERIPVLSKFLVLPPPGDAKRRIPASPTSPQKQSYLPTFAGLNGPQIIPLDLRGDSN